MIDERYKVHYIDISKISLWEEANVRKMNVEQGLDDLAGSIKQNGLQYPLLVKKEGERYLVFNGQRRLLACAKAGQRKIPCFVYSDIDIDNARIMSLSENLYRLTMETEDKTHACKMLLRKYGGDKQKVANALGVNVQTVKKYLGFDALPSEMKRMVGEKNMTASQAIKLYNKFPDENIALNIAYEYASIPKTERKQRQSFFTAASYARSADSLKDVHERAKNIEDAIEYRLLLPAKKSQILERAAAMRFVEKEDVALDFLMERIEMHERSEW